MKFSMQQGVVLLPAFWRSNQIGKGEIYPKHIADEKCTQ